MGESRSVPLYDNALLRGIPRERLSGLGLSLEAAELPTGRVVFEEGAEGECCYLIEQGEIRISKRAPDGGQETLGFMHAGDFFGELALFYDAPRTARATAVVPSCVWCLSRADFERLRAAAPLELTSAIADAGIAHLRELHGELVRIAGDSDRLRELGRGVAVIAHDIRSPLATISLAVGLLEEALQSGQHDAERLSKYAAIIRRTVRHMLDMTTSVLAEVRGQAPRSESLMTARSVAEEVLEQMRGVASGRPVQLVLGVGEDSTLRGDRSDLLRALGNLVRNAIESLPESGGRVELRADVQGGETLFEVADTGIGIPPDVVGRIFERRFTSGKPGGTGLGLGQVRAAVERLGGRIEVESQVGRGTTFRVRVPPPVEPGVADRGASDAVISPKVQTLDQPAAAT